MRLTERDGDKVWFAHGRPRGFLCPREFCDNAYGCDKVKDRTCPYLRLLDKLAAYEDTEDQGLLVRLPCKVGDLVYRIHTRDHVEKHRVIAFHVSVSGLWFWDENGRETPVEKIGETVFLTRAEAEAALGKGGVET